MSFNKPVTDVKENNIVEVQPEVSLNPDINPLIKSELLEQQQQQQVTTRLLLVFTNLET